ncbi:MAG: hypothetical protein AAGJ79_05230 [Verrucomicrobiota bacterium]
MAKLVAAGGHFVELTQAVNTVGSDTSTTIPISADLGLDPVHFSITLSDSEAVVTPAAGALVLVNGSPVGAERQLNEGDKIQAGALELKFEPGPVPVATPEISPSPLANPESAPAAIILQEPASVDPMPLESTSLDPKPAEPVAEDAAEPAPPAESGEPTADDSSSPATVTDLFAAGPVAMEAPVDESSKGGLTRSLLVKVGTGLSVVAILAALGVLGWQNRGLASDLLVTLGFGSRDHSHYVEKYAPSGSIVAGTLKPLDLYRAITRQLSTMTNLPVPISPTSANDKMKEELGVNIYDFEKISFIGNVDGALTVVISFKGEIPGQFLDKIENKCNTTYKSGGLNVYGTNLPNGGNTEIAFVDSHNIVAVLNGTFDQLVTEEATPQTTLLLEQLGAADGSIVVAGRIGPIVDDLENQLLESGIPIPASQFKTVVAQTRAFFKDIDSIVVSTTLSEEASKVTADMFTKPGASIDIASITSLFQESNAMTQASGASPLPAASLAQAAQIFEAAKFTPLENGIRFSLEISNDQFNEWQNPSPESQQAALEEEMSRQRELQEKLQQAALEQGMRAE